MTYNQTPAVLGHWLLILYDYFLCFKFFMTRLIFNAFRRKRPLIFNFSGGMVLHFIEALEFFNLSLVFDCL